MQKKEEYIKPGEAAKMLGISVKTLWRWYQKGYIEARRTPSGRLQYPLEEVKKMVARMNSGRYKSLRGQIWRES